MYNLKLQNIDAVLFDLDGVVTDTARLHIAAWQALFDGFLQTWSTRTHSAFVPFDTKAEYRQYVDGKPRHDGIVSFLASRGITLPYGDPSDPPEQETVCGLGNKKNALFHELLKTQGVTVFAAAVTLIRNLKARGIKTAVVSASKNCAAVLMATGLADLFDTRVDGVERMRLKLAGKPAPDMFLTAARQLGVEPARTAIVEDAIAGVQAGRNGHFCLVIGVAREGNHAVLRQHGADVVVTDLGEVTLQA
jgi:alpha,alpha-trehalase